MNNSMKLLMLIFIGLLWSCSRDDESNKDANANHGYLKIGDQTVELTQGFLENYGVRGNAYNIDLSLKSKSISGNEDGAVVYFELFSSMQNNLAKGDYNLGGYSESWAYTYTKWGQSLLGKNINAAKGGLSLNDGVSIKPTSGSFKVVENSTVYKVSFTGKGIASVYKDGVLVSTQSDVVFSMQYEGDIKRVEAKNFTAKKKSSTERIEKTHDVIFN
ncbi:hypothetical protein [Flavobacterium foetidum]|uniref:hypothetical protein n=1 Tax=Flavobacterium foetidum TaxID=2026681 RepID=UPI0010755905|nr:hypothetical protein [Flavobacterium foetidum]KAF2508313.1 hypothetical protein E0W73_19900 [Flavobacterium foetidum]